MWRSFFLCLFLLPAIAWAQPVDSTPLTTSVLDGTFDEDGDFHPSDRSIERLYDAGDFKTFYEYSTRGNGGAFGVAYELTDGEARLPFLGRERRSVDSWTGQCPPGWKKQENVCERPRRIPLTSELAASEKNIGAQVGWKILPIIDVGAFVGYKWNFREEEWDVTVGVQWIKLSF